MAVPPVAGSRTHVNPIGVAAARMPGEVPCVGATSDDLRVVTPRTAQDAVEARHTTPADIRRALLPRLGAGD